MKHFESPLALKLEEYIAYREGLGYSDKNLRFSLRYFDSYLKEVQGDWNSFKPALFINFRKTLNTEPCTVNEIMTKLRGFFEFLLRQCLLDENPLQYIPPYKENSYIPFVFSHQQVDLLLLAIQKRMRKSPAYFLNDYAVYLAILLMARCGLRKSEPLNLLRTHYRPEEGTIYIEKTKFKKDRLIPLPLCAIREIENYLAVRDALTHDEQNPYLFAKGKQRGLTEGQIYYVFHQGLKDIGIACERRRIANMTFGSPTPHSLRHSFAINTLKRIKEQGKSPQAALPILSAYMGHRKYRYTSLYLKVTDAQNRQRLVDFNIKHQGEL